MDAAAFHERLTRLGLKQHEATEKLGLSPAGLSRQLRGHRPVSGQTEMLLDGLERERTRAFDEHPPAPSPGGGGAVRSRPPNNAAVLDYLRERFARLDGRFDGLDQRLDHLDGRVRRLDLVDTDADTDSGGGP